MAQKIQAKNEIKKHEMSDRRAEEKAKKDDKILKLKQNYQNKSNEENISSQVKLFINFLQVYIC